MVTSCVLSDDDAAQLVRRGIGLTNLVGRPTARADELSRAELRAGGAHLVQRLPALRPRAVAVAGITAYRTAFSRPTAQLGQQDPAGIPDWLPATQLWVVPQPSGLNAHENVDTLAARWREVWAASRETLER